MKLKGFTGVSLALGINGADLNQNHLSTLAAQNLPAAIQAFTNVSYLEYLLISNYLFTLIHSNPLLPFELIVVNYDNCFAFLYLSISLIIN